MEDSEKPVDLENYIKSYKNVRFEPGDHLANVGDAYELNEDWYEASIWKNKEQIIDRLSEYHPQYLTLDGLVPQILVTGWFDNTDYKKDIWARLPGAPKNIRPDNQEVFVVAGDFYKAVYDFNMDDSELHKRMFGDMENEELRNMIGFKVFPPLESTGLIISGGVILTAVELMRAEESSRISDSKHKLHSRRSFLKLAAASVGAGTLFKGLEKFTLNANQASQKASGASSTTAKDYYLEVSKRTASNLFHLEEADARTAVVTIKTREVMLINKVPTNTGGTVLMGYGHSNQANDIIRSHKHSVSVIRRYLSSLDKILLNLSTDFTDIGRKEILTTIGNIMSVVEVYKVKEPDVDSSDPNKPLAALHDSIELVDSFMSPTITSIVQDYVDEIR